MKQHAPGRTIALVMIARDEAPRIARALASVRPFVDAMVVLDTGSTDDTVACARAAGAQVAHFTWTDDFSAARNAALALADADWHLVLDADEWLQDGGDALAALRSAAPDFVGALRVDSQYDAAGGVAVAPSWLPRLLPRAVRYTGRIHEQPAHRLPVRRLAITLGHEGYRETALAAKAGRNARMLGAALVDAPHDPYLHYQLGKDHDVYARYAAAVVCFAQSRACEAAPAGATAPPPAWHHDRLVREIHALKQCRRHAEAVRLADDAMGLWEGSPDYWFTLGDLLLDWAADEPERGGELLPMIEAAWQRCLAIGERPDLEGAVAGRGGALALHNLAVLYDGTGRQALARKMRARIAAGTAEGAAVAGSAPRGK